jgi:4-carboxymuconolactone decarboxylase
MTTSRIAEIPAEDLSAAQRRAAEAVAGGRGFLPTPYKVWLHSAELAGRMEALGTFLNTACSLSPREIEIAVLVIARHWHGEMVFAGHARTAEALGIPAEAIASIAAGEDAAFADPREQAVYAIARSAEAHEAAPDAVFDGAVRALGRDGLAELLALLGYFSAVAIAMKLHRVPAGPRRPPGAGTVP